MDWQPIVTLPEGTLALLFNPRQESNPIWIGCFRWGTKIEETLESESHNAKGRRKIVQEHHTQSREWEGDGWEATHWMPLPAPPKM